jgi:ssDNA thymidine ADP-ribosyltransferase, DarT
MFKLIFNVFTALCSLFESTAKSLNSIAVVAEKMSEDLLEETRRTRKERGEASAHNAQALNNAARVAEDDSGMYLDESRAKRKAKLLALKREFQALEAGGLPELTPPPKQRIVERLPTAHQEAPTKVSVCDSPLPDPNAIANVENAHPEPIEHSGHSQSLPPHRSDRISLEYGAERAIQELAAQRGIEYLVHFTREANLSSILERGLVTRNVLREEGLESNCNDRYRLDGTDAVCASIEFPNYRMFFAKRHEDSKVNWILLLIDPSVLWTTSVAFCITNAASKVVTDVPLQQRIGVAAMEAMFADFGDRARDALNLPDSFPTNPQSEILLLDGVPRSSICGVIASNQAQKVRIETSHAGLKVVVDPSHYRWRSDYEHWR